MSVDRPSVLQASSHQSGTFRVRRYVLQDRLSILVVVQDGGCTIHRVMALPPGVEPSCILAAHFPQAGNAVHHLRHHVKFFVYFYKLV